MQGRTKETKKNERRKKGNQKKTLRLDTEFVVLLISQIAQESQFSLAGAQHASVISLKL